ncbi:MAG: hypothetical protein HXY26_09460 [Hydrogenophilaceae bacterium]|nr:hypothetical protein [Hydrogenophilaceae bacterium]
MTHKGRELGGIALRLGLGLPLVIWLAVEYGWYYADFWLPAYRGMLEILLPDFDVLSLGITAPRGEYLISGEFVPERTLFVQGRMLPKELVINASTLMAHALKPPIVLIAAALAWPGLSLGARGLRLLLSLPFLLVLELADVPLMLASSVNDLMSWSVAPSADAASKLVDWTTILDGGGRIALSLAAAFAVAWLHPLLLQRRQS